MKRPLRRAIVGIGSNSEPRTHIAAGRAALSRQFGRVGFSTMFQSAAADGAGADYFNLAAAFKTALNWSELCSQLKRIEDICGRVRNGTGESQVTLDLDLLILLGANGDDDAHDLDLVELRRASFVLAPLAELLPEWRHPQAAISLARLWADAAPTAMPLLAVRPKLVTTPRNSNLSVTAL
jgi:2-amino-4-hydroxy-6-hydroxymethyldihydropteridine diphosphokinase